MAAKVTVTTSGNLDNARPRLLNGLDRGLILSGMLIAQDASFRAPIDTGRLKRSITVGAPFSVQKGRAISVGSNVEYAKIQEEGGRLPSGGFIRAQPYLKPALEANKEKASEIILKSIVGALKA